MQKIKKKEEYELHDVLVEDSFVQKIATNGDPARARMKELLSGQVIPESEYIDYSLGKMRELQAEGVLLRKRAHQIAKMQERLHMRLIEIGVELDKYGDDVAHFDSVLKTLPRPIPDVASKGGQQ